MHCIVQIGCESTSSFMVTKVGIVKNENKDHIRMLE